MGSEDCNYGPVPAQLLVLLPAFEWVLTEWAPVKAGVHRGMPISCNYQLSYVGVGALRA